MIEQAHLAALRIIHKRLRDSSTQWVVTGSLGMALQDMKVEVHDIDLQTDGTGAYEIESQLAEYVTQPVRYVASEKICSHLGGLNIEGVRVEIMGALRKRIDGKGWEEPVEVEKYRRFVVWEEMEVPVLSLAYEQEAYLRLGRIEKAEAIRRWREKRLAIVPFRRENQQAVKRLILAGMKEHWGRLDESKNPDLEDIASAYADGVFLVAWQDGEIVGTGAFRPVSDETVEIVRMSVKREERRQGIGREILMALCRRAHDEGYRKAVLETTPSWQEVIAFYQAFGFEITHYTGDDVYFALDLPVFFEKQSTWAVSGG